jgi:hypothetical protein
MIQYSFNSEECTKNILLKVLSLITQHIASLFWFIPASARRHSLKSQTSPHLAAMANKSYFKSAPCRAKSESSTVGRCRYADRRWAQQVGQEQKQKITQDQRWS